jgi:hypothetical protein
MNPGGDDVGNEERPLRRRWTWDHVQLAWLFLAGFLLANVFNMMLPEWMVRVGLIVVSVLCGLTCERVWSISSLSWDDLVDKFWGRDLQ